MGVGTGQQVGRPLGEPLPYGFVHSVLERLMVAVLGLADEASDIIIEGHGRTQ